MKSGITKVSVNVNHFGIFFGFLIFAFFLFMMSLDAINSDSLNSRKLLLILVSYSFVLGIVFLGLFSKEGVGFVVVMSVVFFPLLNRSFPYFGFSPGVVSFYYISFEQVYFFMLSLWLFFCSIVKKQLYLSWRFVSVSVAIVVINVSMVLNLILFPHNDNELLVYAVNIMLPSFFFVALVLYYENSGYVSNVKYILSIKYAYILIIVYCVVEFVFKGGEVVNNPSLFFEYGLRLGGGLTEEGYGASVISGGIRDMLYLAFIMSLYPLISKLLLGVGLLSRRVNLLLLVVSGVIVLLVYSKTPIVIYIISLFLSGYIKKGKFLIFLVPSVFIIAQPFIVRINEFVYAMQLLIEGYQSKAIETESSSVGRVIGVLKKVDAIAGDIIYPGADLYVIDNSIVYLWATTGLFVMVFSVLIVLYMLYKFSGVHRSLFAVFVLYSLVAFNNMIGAGGLRSSIMYSNPSVFIDVHGWLPVLVSGNMYFTIFMLAFIVFYDRIKSRVPVMHNPSVSYKQEQSAEQIYREVESFG